ncbi:MAG: response regulator transcription factor [Bacteroidetes bacterium]|nr:DNA-binding response regulator [Bacteroidota bacterium]MBV6461316.1 Oxygen regulatory protein NreC [Flavobacteriales bacterium]WKZ75284.1 MAG: response regulator transcription factor [Vicingaceae bacterium]MCL4816551.1 response regulator transcription factor [Flavobacteriales bacterium]NOG94353.1 response regulator transcription factor [Bacteroidota bacterium]
MEKKEPIKILLVDDHQMFIDGVKALLRKEKKFEIVGEALNGEQALSFITNHDIDILITDISMPGISGVELTKKVKKNNPEIKILVLTMFNDRQVISEIIMAEAEGYILKNTGKQELIHALEKIADNGTFFSNEVVNIMVENSAIQHAEADIRVDVLTERELEILKLICLELTSEQIAEKLFISKRTVDTHRKNIIDKTGIHTLVGLIKFALRNKLASI